MNRHRAGGPAADASRPGATRRQRAETGAVAVETAFVGVVVIALIVGVVESAMVFRNAYVVTSAARAGARLASSTPLSTTFGADTADQVAQALQTLDYGRVQQLWVYKADPVSGEPVGGSGCASSCYQASLSASGAVSVTGSWTARQACPDGAGVTDSVGVRVVYRTDAFPGWFLKDKIIRSTSVMRLEPQVGGASTKCVSS